MHICNVLWKIFERDPPGNICSLRANHKFLYNTGGWGIE